MVNDAWLSGFIDGEGCFTIAKGGRGDRCYTHKFAIAQRADDGILQQIADAFGYGNVYKHSRVVNPVSSWQCQSHGSALKLVDYLDRFPLRTRKAHDYAVWRESLLFYLRHTKGGAGPTGNPKWLDDAMQERYELMKKVKLYNAKEEAMTPSENECPQHVLF